MLAALVSAGTLPPIDQRLPDEVFVVGPGVLLQTEFQDWQDGKHGGTINVAETTQSFFLGLGGCSTILRSPGQTSTPALPNVVSAFSHSDDFQTFHLTLRKGLKWSDGQPVTTEDVRFTFDDLYKDPDVQYPWATELYNLGNSNLGTANLKVIDDFSFDLIFNKTYGQFVTILNSWIPNYEILIKPSHYLKQFHKKYAKQADLDAALQKNNQTNWVQLIQQMDVVHWDQGTPAALGMPVLNAWVLTGVNGDQRVFDRNPYFWHVDKSGRQLPYVDKIVNNIAIDPDATVNATLAGHVDIAAERDAPLNKMPVFKQNADNAGFRIFTTHSFNNPLQLFLNQDYQYDDPNSVWQKLITDPEKRFGQAIGFAINAQDIGNSVFFGLFGPPFSTTKVFDAAKAKQLLDAVGMDKLDSDNFRLGPDGKPFLLEIAYAVLTAEFDPVAELLSQQLQAVGIRVKLESSGTDQTAWTTKALGNQLMSTIHWNDGPAWHTAISEDYLRRRRVRGRRRRGCTSPRMASKVESHRRTSSSFMTCTWPEKHSSPTRRKVKGLSMTCWAGSTRTMSCSR